ncbi:MAG: uracil-DNA glycosylase [Micrococcales bacterium]
MWFEQMHPTWQSALAGHKIALTNFEAELAKLEELSPEKKWVMAAFEADPSQTKVVILGQDPYPTAGAAIGHAFAVSQSTKLPASLKNIERELKSDLGVSLSDPELSHWRSQGVWLLNTCLTTLENRPNAHSKIGWQAFTEAALSYLTAHQPVVILAWGKPANDLANRVSNSQTSIVSSAHPSPLSAHRGFLGSKPFSRANEALQSLGHSPIDW